MSSMLPSVPTSVRALGWHTARSVRLVEEALRGRRFTARRPRATTLLGSSDQVLPGELGRRRSERRPFRERVTRILLARCGRVSPRSWPHAPEVGQERHVGNRRGSRGLSRFATARPNRCRPPRWLATDPDAAGGSARRAARRRCPALQRGTQHQSGVEVAPGRATIVPIAILFVVVLTFVLSKTSFGRHVYAVGGNAEAARRAGINVGRIKIACFMIGSTLAASAASCSRPVITQSRRAPAVRKHCCTRSVPP